MTVSRHFLRRTARAKAKRLNLIRPNAARYSFEVERTHRGPFRWRVIRVNA